MLKVDCPECSQPLRLRLLPDFDSCLYCQSCGKAIDLEYISKAGVPTDLIGRIKDWDRRSPKIAGAGIESELGDDLNDREYILAWKEVREQTISILKKLNELIPSKADVMAVFELKQAPEWTDEEIAAWRRKRQRERLFQDYGWLLGRKHVASGGKPPEESEVIPRPSEMSSISPEELRLYQAGFYLGAHIGSQEAVNTPSFLAELAVIEQRLWFKS